MEMDGGPTEVLLLLLFVRLRWFGKKSCGTTQHNTTQHNTPQIVILVMLVIFLVMPFWLNHFLIYGQLTATSASTLQIEASNYGSHGMVALVVLVLCVRIVQTEFRFHLVDCVDA